MLKIFTVLAMFVSTTPALATKGKLPTIPPKGSQCSAYFGKDSQAIPPELTAEINVAQQKIADAERIILENGGHTPETLLKIQPGTELVFNDGATFAVSNPQYSNALVRFDFRSPDQNTLVSPGRDFELLVAGYPENNPAMDVISNGMLPQNPTNNLKFIRANYQELQKIIPLRKFVRIAEDGSYAIVEKIPPYKGKLMTFKEFLESKTLTLEEREKIGESLVQFVKEAVGVRFASLHLPDAIVFDPRDSKWKFLTVDAGIRRFKTDNLAGPLNVHIETSLTFDKLGDKAFTEALFRKLEEVNRDHTEEVSRQSRLEELKVRAPLAGIYKFSLVLKSGDKIQGELDTTSAARIKGELVSFKGSLIDKDGKIKETAEKEYPVTFALNVGRPSFSMFKEFKELKDYYAIPLPTEVNKPMRVKMETGEVEIVRTK